MNKQKQPHRRQFLGAACASGLMAQVTQPERDHGVLPFGYFRGKPLRIGNAVQLLADDYVVENRWKLTRRQGGVAKHLRNPVIAGALHAARLGHSCRNPGAARLSDPGNPLGEADSGVHAERVRQHSQGRPGSHGLLERKDGPQRPQGARGLLALRDEEGGPLFLSHCRLSRVWSETRT